MSAHHHTELHNAGPGHRGVSRGNGDLRTGLKRKPESTYPRVSGARYSQDALHEHAIASEDLFLHTLSVERKRSERSGDAFMLVVLRSAELFQGKSAKSIIGQFQEGVLSVIREIDVAGWYEDQAALGVIFTEIGKADETVVTAILERLTVALRSSLNPEHVEKVAVSCHIFPDEAIDGHGNGDKMRFYPDVPRIEKHRWSARMMKRSIDIVGSLIAILVLFPVALIIAALIKLTSKGPVLFRQQRIGQYGAPFTFLKFRSMYVNNDAKIHQEYVAKLIAGNVKAESGVPAFKIKNDPRVTRIGHFLRRTSLDELPQFFNVLKGDMSLVGPRPPLPYEVGSYDLWHRRRVLEVRPGITGLWQVNGRSRVTFNEMVRLDLNYARNWSIALDLKILCKTPKAVLAGEGAY